MPGHSECRRLNTATQPCRLSKHLPFSLLGSTEGVLPFKGFSVQEKSTIAAIQSESGTHSTSGSLRTFSHCIAWSSLRGSSPEKAKGSVLDFSCVDPPFPCARKAYYRPSWACESIPLVQIVEHGRLQTCPRLGSAEGAVACLRHELAFFCRASLADVSALGKLVIPSTGKLSLRIRHTCEV